MGFEPKLEGRGGKMWDKVRGGSLEEKIMPGKSGKRTSHGKGAQP